MFATLVIWMNRRSITRAVVRASYSALAASRSIHVAAIRCEIHQLKEATNTSHAAIRTHVTRRMIGNICCPLNICFEGNSLAYYCMKEVSHSILAYP